MTDGSAVGDQVAAPGGGEQTGVAGWNVPGYTGLKKLGSGGFGDVVLARHDESGTLVAIKYLRQELLSDAEFAEMFRGEAAVLASIDDPHVVRLYDYVESPSGAAIVMELVDGVSLRDILERSGETTPEAALVVLEGSLLGLAAAHAPRGGAPGLQAGQRAGERGRGKQADRLRDRGPGRGPADAGGHADVRGAGADRRRAGQPGRGCVRGHGDVLRVPDRAAAVPRGHRPGAAVPASVPAGAGGRGARAGAAAE